MIGCLIIHGYTGGPYEVEPLANYLRDNTDWHIEVPTLPGHGTELNLENASYESWIQAAEEELQTLIEQFETIYVIGFSMGGMIASYLAAKYKIDRLVLLATSGKYLCLKQLGLDAAAVIGDGLRGHLKENQLFNHYKKKMGVVPLKAHFEFMKLVRFTRKYLDKVKSPVLIAQGQLDGMVPYKTAYYLDKLIHSEKKEVVFFERSKHLICLGTDKDTLNNMIYGFLTESPA
ncbi:carboxylesterase [Oceanobacillus sojae]|uniref:alpha/beta hydrolase n=1 Tax=Oceanobacillus sojae TaxID=582851 RepID=UPI0021A4E1CB|nr:alpha/beta fold hydrolase [Oceanobacillus sojae]MCT1902846.1 alpha/beta fold hydrolase [Oceanobacillus sojae]